MISWIQLSFQKHFRTMFAVLLAITIISFIFTIGAAPGIGRGDRKVLTRPFFGYNLGSQEDMSRISRDGSLSVMLRAGYMALDSQQFQDYVQRRVAALDLASQLKVPAPTQQQLTDYIKTLGAFVDDKGQFDANKYALFLNQLKTNPQMNEGDVSRVISEDYRFDQIQKKLGGPGYVLPGDIKTLLVRADSAWTLGVASVDYASYAVTTTPSDAEITKFFEDNAFRYEVPPRINTSYVEFSPASYMAEVVLKDDEVKAYYEANQTRFAKPAAAKPESKVPLSIKLDAPESKPADTASDFQTVRPQVEAALKQEMAARRAAKAAADLTLALYEQKLAADSPSLGSFLASRQLVLKGLPPLRRDAKADDLPIPSEAVAEAFKLGEKRFFSDPVTNASGTTVVLFWKETLPSYKPLLAEVKANVVADYQENDKRKKFTELGKNLRSALETHIKAGDSFEKAAAALSGTGGGQLKIESKIYPSFTLRQPAQDVPYPVLGALEHLGQGQVSDLVVAKDTGYLVYLQDKKLPSFVPDNPQYAAAKAQLSQASAGVTQSLALSELVAAELAKSQTTN